MLVTMADPRAAHGRRWLCLAPLLLLVLLDATEAGLRHTRGAAQIRRHLGRSSKTMSKSKSRSNVFGGKGGLLSNPRPPSSKGKTSKSTKSKSGKGKGKGGSDKAPMIVHPLPPDATDPVMDEDTTPASEEEATMASEHVPGSIIAADPVQGHPLLDQSLVERTEYSSQLDQLLSKAYPSQLESPNVRQSQAVCNLNANGFYGEPVGQPYTVTFAYQAIVRDGTTETLISNQVAPALDVAIAQALLPEFFDCATRRGRRRLQAPTITGLSRLLTDIPLFNANCIGSAASNPCFVFAGYVSVFGENFFTQAQVDDVVKPAIQRVMQGGALDNVDLLVTDVQYIDDGFQTVAPLPTQAPVPPPPPVAGIPTPAPVPVPGTPAPAGSLPPAGAPSTPAPAPVVAAPTPAAPATDPPIQTPAPINNPLLPTPPPAPATPAPSAAPITTVPTLPGTTPKPTDRATAPPAGGGPAPTPPLVGAVTARPTVPAPAPTVERAQAQGIEKVQWWGWLLVGLGGAGILLCCCFFFRGMCCSGGGARPVNKTTSDGPNGTDDDYEPPGVDAYVPPSPGASFDATPTLDSAYVPPPPMGTFNSQPDALDHIDEEQDYGYGEEEGDEEYDDEEGEGEYDDEYDDGEGEYDDGEGEYDDDEYDDEEGESYEEEESYYEEETIGGHSQEGDHGRGAGEGGGWGNNPYGGATAGSY